MANLANLYFSEQKDLNSGRSTNVSFTVADNLGIASGLIPGWSLVAKFGRNADVDTATVPEDLWNGGGAYTGFPSGAETVQVFSSDAADTAAGTGARQVTFTGLDANYNALSETVTLNGVTPVVSTGSFLRVHTARVISAGSGGVNAGTITIRQSTTTTAVFVFMPIGYNQSLVGAYTVPAGKTGYINRINGSVRGGVTAVVDGYLWIREFGEVFRARRPFTISNSQSLLDITGGVSIPEKSDVVVRITFSSTNNIEVIGGFDIYLRDNTLV